MRSPKQKKIEIEDAKDVPTKIMAESIINISEGFRRLRNGGLNEKALLVLLAHASGEPQVTVKNVLWAIDSLRSLYVK